MDRDFWISLAAYGLANHASEIRRYVRDERQAKNKSMEKLSELLSLPEKSVPSLSERAWSMVGWTGEKKMTREDAIEKIKIEWLMTGEAEKVKANVRSFKVDVLRDHLSSNSTFRGKYLKGWRSAFPSISIPKIPSVNLMVALDYAIYEIVRQNMKGLDMKLFYIPKPARVEEPFPPAVHPSPPVHEVAIRRSVVPRSDPISSVMKEALHRVDKAAYIVRLSQKEVAKRISYTPVSVKISPIRGFAGNLALGETRSLEAKENLSLFRMTKEELNPAKGPECGDLSGRLRNLRNYQKFQQSVLCPFTKPQTNDRGEGHGQAGLLMWATTGAGKTCAGKAVISTFLWDLSKLDYHRFSWITDGSLSSQTIKKKTEICGWRQLTDILYPIAEDPLSTIMHRLGFRDISNPQQRMEVFSGEHGSDLIDAYLGNPIEGYSTEKHFGNSRASTVLTYGRLLNPLQKAFRGISRVGVDDPFAGLCMLIDEAHLLFGASGEGKGLGASRVKTQDDDRKSAEALTHAAFDALSKWRIRQNHENKMTAAGLLAGVAGGLFNQKEYGVSPIYRVTAAIAYSNLVNPRNPVRVFLLTATPIRNDFREFFHLMNLTRQFPHDPTVIHNSMMEIEGGTIGYKFPVETAPGRWETQVINPADLFSGSISLVKADENPRQYPIKIAMSRCSSDYPRGTNLIDAGLISCEMSPYQFAMFQSAAGGKKEGFTSQQLRKMRIALTMVVRYSSRTPVEYAGVAPTIEQLISAFKQDTKMLSRMKYVSLDIETFEGEEMTVQATQAQQRELLALREARRPVGIQLGRDNVIHSVIVSPEGMKGPGVFQVKTVSHPYASLRFEYKDLPHLKYTHIKPGEDLYTRGFGARVPRDLSRSEGKKREAPPAPHAGAGVAQRSSGCEPIRMTPEFVEGLLSSEPIWVRKEPGAKIPHISIDARFDAPKYSPSVLTSYHPALEADGKILHMKGLELISSKFMKLLQMIHNLDKKGIRKHCIYTDLKVQRFSTAPSIVGALMACPMLGSDGNYYMPQLQGISPSDFEDGKLKDMVYVIHPNHQADGSITWTWHRIPKCKEAPTILLLSSSGVRQPTNHGSDLWALKSSPRKKDILFSYFNDRKHNAFGENARFVVIDQYFRQGIDLFNTPYMHILDVPLSEADFTQTIGRISRLCGSAQLDFNEACGWQDKIFVYLSTMCKTWPCSGERPVPLYWPILNAMRSLGVAEETGEGPQKILEVEKTEKMALDPRNGLILDHELNAAFRDSGYGTDFCSHETCGSGDKMWKLWSEQKRLLYSDDARKDRLEGISDLILSLPSAPPAPAPAPSPAHNPLANVTIFVSVRTLQGWDQRKKGQDLHDSEEAGLDLLKGETETEIEIGIEDLNDDQADGHIENRSKNSK